MPGYTHLQRAQPTTFAHYMMAYANMFKRDVTRLEDCLERLDECPLGAGALATTTYPVDRFADRPGPGLRQAHRQLHGRRLRPGLRHRAALRPVHPDDASVPVLRGDHPLVLLGVQVHGPGRRLLHRLLHHAPEEEPRRGRAGPGQDGPGVRRSDHPADHDEGPAPGLQQGHAGGQGGPVRRRGHGGAVPSRLCRHGGHPDGAPQKHAPRRRPAASSTPPTAPTTWSRRACPSGRPI